MPRVQFNVTGAFKDAVTRYQEKEGLASWSYALLSLAALGLQATGEDPPVAYHPRGGYRVSKEIRDQLDQLIAYADLVTDGGKNDPAEDGDEPPETAD